jgi:hypothetical protein
MSDTRRMNPADVPDELVDLAHKAARRSDEPDIAGMLDDVLAAVLPEYERQVREKVADEIAAERGKARDAEGATLRDENVINGIVNGLGIALKIARGEAS